MTVSELMVTITATPRSPNLPSLSKSQPILFQSPTFRERSGSMLRLDAESPRAAGCAIEFLYQSLLNLADKPVINYLGLLLLSLLFWIYRLRCSSRS